MWGRGGTEVNSLEFKKERQILSLGIRNYSQDHHFQMHITISDLDSQSCIDLATDDLVTSGQNTDFGFSIIMNDN